MAFSVQAVRQGVQVLQPHPGRAALLRSASSGCAGPGGCEQPSGRRQRACRQHSSVLTRTVEGACKRSSPHPYIWLCKGRCSYSSKGRSADWLPLLLHRGLRREMQTLRCMSRSSGLLQPSRMRAAPRHRPRQPCCRARGSTAAQGRLWQPSRPLCTGRSTCRRTAQAPALSGKALKLHHAAKP